MESVQAYGRELRDRLWMWGHETGVYDGPDGIFGIPVSDPITMPDAIRSMGIPNLCVIRDGTPGEDYVRAFAEVKRVAWSLAMGTRQSFSRLKDYAFGLREALPNLTGYYLDDFFCFQEKSDFDRDDENTPAPAVLTVDELAALHAELQGGRRRLDLTLVLYVHLLCPAIKRYMEHTDIASLWIWHGTDIAQIDANYRKYRSLVPDKPTMLGIYMWDFGNSREMPVEAMKRQLDYAHGLYLSGEIEGLIFHCTPLCNKGLPAVDYARRWIAEHAEDVRQRSESQLFRT